MLNRMVRASQLDAAVYEEVERDVDLTTQAATVVGVVAVATGIGQLRDGGVGGLIFGIISAFVWWVVFSAVAYWVGKTIFKTANTRVSLGEMLRTLGFSQSPGILAILAIIGGGIGAIVLFAVGIWRLITGVIAIRQAMDFSTGRAVATGIIAFIPAAIVAGLLLAIPAAIFD